MKSIPKALAKEMRGIFTITDLQVIFPSSSRALLNQRVQLLVKKEELAPYCRGVYVTPGFFDPYLLSQVLCSKSYISFETVLSQSLVIGSKPVQQVVAVKLGKERRYQNELLTIKHLGIKKELFFGFEVRDGVQIAVPEKALLDTFYFYLRGHKFSFDLYSDLSLSSMNIGHLRKMLTRYQNPKFVAFVKNLLGGYGYDL